MDVQRCGVIRWERVGADGEAHYGLTEYTASSIMPSEGEEEQHAGKGRSDMVRPVT